MRFARSSRQGIRRRLAVAGRVCAWASCALLWFGPNAVTGLEPEPALGNPARLADPDQLPSNPVEANEGGRAQLNPVRVTGQVVDQITGDPLPCRIYIQSENGAWHFATSAADEGTAVEYRKRNWINPRSEEMHTTLSAHPFEARLPPGRYTITVERGKEYFPATAIIEVERESLTLENCGFRMKPSAGTASGVHPVPLGFGRVYVQLEDGFDYREWIGGLGAGRSFVTTGPMLMVTVNDRPPGNVFVQSDPAATYRLDGTIVSEVPLESIELIVNGEVAQSIPPDNRRDAVGAFHHTLENRSIDVTRTSWFAVRCFETARAGGKVRFAHTGPFHVEVQERPMQPRRVEVEFLVNRVREQIERSATVLSEDALDEYRQALARYEALLETAR